MPMPRMCGWPGLISGSIQGGGHGAAILGGHELVQATVLGLVQGLTEFLPISSSAHVRVVSALADWPDPGASFTAITQLGTELAVLIYFRRDIAGIIVAWATSLLRPEGRQDPLARLGWFII